MWWDGQAKGIWHRFWGLERYKEQTHIQVVSSEIDPEWEGVCLVGVRGERGVLGRLWAHEAPTSA